ncbi:hypothetical protein A3860_27250 [Niastella vici]|uniref:Uncharacterized protein n=1 Tax=Niastella vici TaxID=1703345 RepID=A0A1V9FWG3_9BACT|nr:hypothetical protein A3860_27250 [Niastella vici]
MTWQPVPGNYRFSVKPVVQIPQNSKKLFRRFFDRWLYFFLRSSILGVGWEEISVNPVTGFLKFAGVGVTSFKDTFWAGPQKRLH